MYPRRTWNRDRLYGSLVPAEEVEQRAEEEREARIARFSDRAEAMAPAGRVDTGWQPGQVVMLGEDMEEEVIDTRVHDVHAGLDALHDQFLELNQRFHE